MDQKIIQEAISKISSADPVLIDVFRSIKPLEFKSRALCFENTARIIINQQLSGKAAATIYQRVLKEVGEFTPQKLQDIPADDLRSCGLSYAKISYIKSLAEKCTSRATYFIDFLAMDDDVAFSTIRDNKGFGDWSASIFLLFHLQRTDVFPIGDATLNGAISRLYNLDKTDSGAIYETAKRWSPFRSIACLALWRWMDAGKPEIS